MSFNVVDCANVSNGEIGFCKCHTCSKDEGNCDSNNECMDTFWCGSQNCPEHLGYGSEVNCCDFPELFSPNYPESYEDYYTDLHTWLITADIGTIINVQFYSFHVCLFY